MPDVLANGVIVPKPTEPISASGVAEMRSLGQSVDTALGQVPDPWARGLLPDGADMNALNSQADSGLYGISSARTYLNLPFTGEHGVLEVKVSASVGGYQEVTQYVTGARWRREITNYYSSPRRWSDWEDVPDQQWVTDQIRATAHQVTPRLVPEGTDLTAIAAGERLEPGFWSVDSITTAATITGLPPDMGRCTFQQFPFHPDAISAARLLLGSGDTGVWYQAYSSGGWMPWQRLDAGGGATPSAPSLGSHEVRVQALRRARGGRIGTAGKGIIAFRFDHYMDAFQSTILPELVARGIPASQCHFADQIDPPPTYTGGDESTSSSWDEIQNNAIQHGIEVWGHGWTHQDASTTEGMMREFVESRAELESRMPEVEVTGLMVPGVTGSRFGGFSDAMGSSSAWSDYEAGRIIAATYASCNGAGASIAVPGVSLGWQYQSIERETTSAVAVSRIEEAARSGSASILMMHPGMLDQPGRMSLTVLREILDYAVALRDAGEIEILTVGGVTVADPGSSWRHTISRPVVDYTLGDGWSVADGAIVSAGTTSAAVTVLYPSRTDSVGHPREAIAEVTGAGTLTMRVYEPDGLLDTSVTHTGPGTARLPFVPPISNSFVRVELTATGDPVTVTSVGLQAI